MLTRRMVEKYFSSPFGCFSPESLETLKLLEVGVNQLTHNHEVNQ